MGTFAVSLLLSCINENFVERCKMLLCCWMCSLFMNRIKASGNPAPFWRRSWWQWKTRWQERWFPLVVQIPEGLIPDCVNLEDLERPQERLGGICVQYSLDPIVTVRSSQRLSPLRRGIFHGMTRNSGCTFSGLLCFGVESCFTSCSRALGEKSHGRTLSITIFPKE